MKTVIKKTIALSMAALMSVATFQIGSAKDEGEDRMNGQTTEMTDRFYDEQLDNYNIKWTSQSKNAGESMPVGGGDVGLNVWVENDDLLFYIGKTDAFDENSQLMKLGRVRIRLTPNPFANGTSFEQEFILKEG